MVGKVIPPELQLQKDYGHHTRPGRIALLVKKAFCARRKVPGLTSTIRIRDVVTEYLRANDRRYHDVSVGLYFPVDHPRHRAEAAGKWLPRCWRARTTMSIRSGSVWNRCSAKAFWLIVEPTKSNQYNPNLAYYLSFKERGIPVVMINANYEELSVPFICVTTRKGISLR